ncbi:MAG: peptidyl-prolyl cis-trans isomerase [Myxococcales bacterium]|nr:MAG: peptidyl-prolyl cis-trans isomerase [Myxococcales bacterium]
MRHLFYMTLCSVLSLLGGCNTAHEESHHSSEKQHGLSSKEANTVLAQVGDVKITAGDVAERLAAQSPYLRSQYRSLDRRQEFLENLIRFELLAQEAKRLGYDKAPTVKRAKNKAMIEVMIEDEIDSKLKLENISEQQIQDYYQSHPEEYDKPAQVRLSQIVVSDEATANSLLKKLNEKKDEKRHELFVDFVKQYSIDTQSKEALGDLQFLSKPTDENEQENHVPAAVAHAGFALKKVGDLYPNPIQSTQGFHIVQLTAKRDALRRNLEEVRRPIQNMLLRKQRDALLDQLIGKLRKESTITEKAELLNTLDINGHENASSQTP